MLALAGWIAPAATMIAAIMTAVNLGTRITGLGFAVFAVGAMAWIVVAATSGQQNLLISNVFLLAIDGIGMWRWLGRQARYDAGAREATDRSAKADAPTLFPLTTLAGMAVRDATGQAFATVVDAMAARTDGTIAYLVVGEGGAGGVGERLHALGWHEVTVGDDGMKTRLDAAALGARGTLHATQWPASARSAGVA